MRGSKNLNKWVFVNLEKRGFGTRKDKKSQEKKWSNTEWKERVAVTREKGREVE